MSRIINRALASAVVAAATFGAVSASQASEASGIWYDHTGRGAVELVDCGGKLCGKLVWVQNAAHAKEVCGKQIIGNAKPVGSGKWDGGWIYDPDRNGRYNVEITSLGGGRLQVMGYAGSKFLSALATPTYWPACASSPSS